MSRFKVWSLCVAVLSVTGLAQAGEYTVTGVHNCCGACNKKITEALTGVEGVTGIQAKAKTDTVKFTAPDDKTAQKAVDALANSGFHGKVEGSKEVAFKDDSKVEAGKVKKLELVGIHNCCPGCANAIKDLAGGVDGVTAQTITAKGESVVVEGDFDAKAVVKALYDGGFHVRAKE